MVVSGFGVSSLEVGGCYCVPGVTSTWAYCAMADPQVSVVILRLSFSRYLAAVRMRAVSPFVFLLVVIALVKLLAHPLASMVFLYIIIAGGWLLMIAPIVLYLALARIRLEGDRVTWRALVRRGSFPIEAVGRVEVSDISATFGVSEPVLIILDRQEHRLLRLRSSYWSEDAIAELREFLNKRFYL